MGRKSPYPEEFRRDAVALHRAAAGKRTYASVTADLGITAESLRTWVRKDDAQAVPEGRDGGASAAEELARLLKAEQEWQLEPTEQARAERRAEEKRTVSEIRAIHAEHHGAYGALRVHAELRARGRRINRKRVTRLMRINHIVGRHLWRKKRTTIADGTAPPVPDPVMRDFTADTLNTRWCGDITYTAVGGTWLYLATVIDICSRRVVGWSIADHMRTSLVTDAIEMAVAARGGPVRGVVFHTDRDDRLNPPDTVWPPSPRSATGTVSGAAWAGSARATTMPSPSRSSRASSANCSMGGVGPRRHRLGWSCFQPSLNSN